jgi:hypothetical protein
MRPLGGIHRCYEWQRQKHAVVGEPAHHLRRCDRLDLDAIDGRTAANAIRLAFVGWARALLVGPVRMLATATTGLTVRSPTPNRLARAQNRAQQQQTNQQVDNPNAQHFLGSGHNSTTLSIGLI